MPRKFDDYKPRTTLSATETLILAALQEPLSFTALTQRLIEQHRAQGTKVGAEYSRDLKVVVDRLEVQGYLQAQVVNRQKLYYLPAVNMH